MEYKPERNNIRTIIIAALLLADLILIVLFLNMDSSRIRGMLTFIFLLINAFGLYLIRLIITLKYILTDQELIITGTLNLRKIKIPVSDIESWSRKITLLDTSGLGLSTARFAIGKGLDNNGDQAELLITSSKKVIYLKTKNGNYGISPEKADEFIAQLKALDIPQQSGSERRYLQQDQNRSRSNLNQIMLYCILLMAILLLIPVVMYFTGLMPQLVRTAAVSYMTRKAYLEAVFTRGLIALVVMLVSYGVTILLSAIEGKYYYRIMFIPLIFVIVLLFFEVNTQLNVLMG